MKQSKNKSLSKSLFLSYLCADFVNCIFYVIFIFRFRQLHLQLGGHIEVTSIAGTQWSGVGKCTKLHQTLCSAYEQPKLREVLDDSKMLEMACWFFRKLKEKHTQGNLLKKLGEGDLSLQWYGIMATMLESYKQSKDRDDTSHDDQERTIHAWVNHHWSAFDYEKGINGERRIVPYLNVTHDFSEVAERSPKLICINSH